MAPIFDTSRTKNWRWWVTVLLLMATMVNYMDRLTLSQLAVAIEKDLSLTDSDYANLQACFGLAFALGAIVFGLAVDRWNVFWVYPFAVLAWSAAGFCSGFAQSFAMLLIFRTCLGFAESANWPCALRTTQHIMPPGERAMGNSILQSGAAVGAVLIPLVIEVLVDPAHEGSWRLPFFVVGTVGALWVGLWWCIVRPTDLRLHHEPADTNPALPGLPRPTFIRRFLVLIVLVVTINMTWHFLSAWGPKFLQRTHGFTQRQTNFFSAGYYVFTDLGALSAGFVTLRLWRKGLAVRTSRLIVFLFCALLAGMCVLVPLLPSGAALVVTLLAIGFGSLGVFPIYYSCSQDLTVRHQGKVTGLLSCGCWLALALWQISIGEMVTVTGSYTGPFIIAGLVPMVGFLALLLFWGPTEESVVTVSIAPLEKIAAASG